MVICDNMRNLNYKVDGERALISLGGPCNYGCNYCYIYEPGFKGFPINRAKEIVSTLDSLPKEVKLIQCGYDNEFFINENEALELIKGISDRGLNLSFSTKKDLSLETISELGKINDNMEIPQYMIACVSILGFDTARKLEPNAPDPEKRVETIHRLYERGIKTLVYLRPLLPEIPDHEIEEVFSKTIGFCDGYVVGKAIYDSRNSRGLTSETKKRFEWSLDQRKWSEFTDPRVSELARRPDVYLHRREAFATILGEEYGQT
jgi:DNA repair photolyase